MKTPINKIFFIVFISFFLQTINAQDPNWTVSATDYQYSMTFTTFLNVNGTTLTSSNDKVAAFVNDELRGVASVVYVASVDKYVSYLSVFANTDTEIIDFKIYNSATEEVVNIDKTEVFSIDGNIGGIFQSYSIANPQLNEKAVFNSFSFSGITSVSEDITSDKRNIVLPLNTNLNDLTAVFDASVNSKVFIDGVLQRSGSSPHDFTNTIEYQVLSENEATVTTYEVSVSTALNNDPTTVSIASSVNLNTNVIPVSLDISFSKVVSGFDQSDLLLENAVVSSLVTSDFQNYKIDIIPLSQGIFSAQITASSTLDGNSNQNEISNKIDLMYDISKPVISVVSVEEDISSWWFLVTFSEEVVNVDSTDFELKGMASFGLVISEVSIVSANQYKIEISNSSEGIGTISLQLKSTNDIKDIVGNSVVNSEFEAYYLNNESLTVGDNFASNSFSIYPNPSNGFVKIRQEEGSLEQILLYDLSGKKVFVKNCNQQETTIDIQKLKPGIYFVKIISTEGIFVKEIIKTN